MAEIDDSRAYVVRDQSVKKSHLAAGVSDIDNRRNVRQKVGQLRTFVGQVECCHRSITDDVEFSEQSRNERLSDASTWGANDVKWGGLIGHSRVRLPTAHLGRVKSRAPSTSALFR
jgi:hypothetical protein